METEPGTMTSHECWIFVILGIVAFSQLATAVDFNWDNEAHIFRDIAEDAEARKETCLKLFNKMMNEATSDLETKNMSQLAETMAKITQDFLSCRFTSANDVAVSQKMHDPREDDEDIHHFKHRPKYRLSTEIRKTDDGNAVTSVSDQAINQIQDFLQRPDYYHVIGVLLDQLHDKIKEFINSGLEQEHHHLNYIELLEHMLDDVAGFMLSEDLVQYVQALIDKELELYATNKIEIPVSTMPQDLYDLIDPKTANQRQCIIEEFETALECVYKHVIDLVTLQWSLESDDKEWPHFWEPFGLKLVAHLQNLLVQIINQPKKDETKTRRFGGSLYEGLTVPDIPQVEKVPGFRPSFLSCMGLISEKVKQENQGNFNAPEQYEAIDKCMESASEDMKDIIQSMMLKAGMDQELLADERRQKSFNGSNLVISSLDDPLKISDQQTKPPEISPGPINFDERPPFNLPMRKKLFRDIIKPPTAI